MSKSVEKISHQIQKEISIIIQNEVKNTKIGYITITDTKVTNDLSLATIYYSILGDDNRKKAAQEGLESSNGFIRSELSKRIHMRKVPELKFKYDISLENGNKIDKLLEEL